MQRHDWTGELVDDEDTDGHECSAGWIDRERARPCERCRPWLCETPARPPTRAELDELCARLGVVGQPARRRRLHIVR